MLPRRGFSIHHVSTVLDEAGLFAERIDPVEVRWQCRPFACSQASTSTTLGRDTQD